MLGKAEVQSQLNNYITNRTFIATEYTQTMQAHANMSRNSTREAATLKHLTKEALQQVWMFFEVYLATEAEAFNKKLALVIWATDVVLNI
ncbi:MAG: hypothetical protein ACKPKO_33205 [Candidatus Fonsibacter sp.]